MMRMIGYAHLGVTLRLVPRVKDAMELGGGLAEWSTGMLVLCPAIAISGKGVQNPAAMWLHDRGI